MRIRILALAAVFGLIFFIASPGASADTLKLRDGTTLEGVIKKVEQGTVYFEIGTEERTVGIREVESMDFNTPHLLAESSVPVDHFLKNIEAQEIVRNIEQLEKSAGDIRKKLGQIRTTWGSKQPITAQEERGWDAAREEFRRPLALYQELLNDLYFHVLAKVDEYNLMAKEARKVYVGVKGIRVGSPLISSDMERLPLKKYVPAAWYDTIFYEGYNLGYDDAYQKISGKSDSNN
jgi:hypothetical protein